MKYYAVKNGRKCGIFATWAECKAQVDGYSGAEYKSFVTKAEAEAYIIGREAENKSQSDAVAYVDGSYNVKTGEYSYGVLFIMGEVEEEFCQKFAKDEKAEMRNVAGEITASIFAIEYAIKKGAKSVEIAYDYAGIEKWATGEWKANLKWTQEYALLYRKLSEQIEVKFRKVKGHSGDKCNDRADKLAKSALGIA